MNEIILWMWGGLIGFAIAVFFVIPVYERFEFWWIVRHSKLLFDERHSKRVFDERHNKPLFDEPVEERMKKIAETMLECVKEGRKKNE